MEHGPPEVVTPTGDLWSSVIVATVEVLRVERVTPRMLRVTLTGDDLQRFDASDTPNKGVRLFLPTLDGDAPDMPIQDDKGVRAPAAEDSTPSRSYTVRRFDAATLELDIDVVIQHTGPGSVWASRAAPGTTVGMAGPILPPVPPAGRDWYLLAGDESALPAIATLLEHFAPTARVHAFLEVEDEAEVQELLAPDDSTITWLFRYGAEPGTSGVLEDAIRALEWEPGPMYAWLAGEIREIGGIRRYLRDEHGLDRHSLLASGYWRRGLTQTESQVVTEERVQSLVAAGRQIDFGSIEELSDIQFDD